MNQPEPQSLAFPVLMADIEKGLIKIPQFQRDFVWSKEKSAELLDSVLKGYPIGTFILWKTKVELRTVRNIGGVDLPETPEGDYVQHVLDGQQRLTSLYASVRGLRVHRDNRLEDFSSIFLDLQAAEDETIVITDPVDHDPATLIRVVDLHGGDLVSLSKYPPYVLQRLDELRMRLRTYAFSVILVKDAPLEVATEIFTRINVTGQALSVFEIMVAKTFDAPRGFDLAVEYERFMEELGEADYDTFRPMVILQVVSAILRQECGGKDVLRSDKADFIDVWPRATDAIRYAVDYFRNYFRIPVSHLLPYPSLLVPFAYFFYHSAERPNVEQQAFLEEFFWRTSIGEHYVHSSDTRTAADLKKIDSILQGVRPTYDYPVPATPEAIRENGSFGTNRAYIKAILCLLAFQEPKSFSDNSIVRLSNDWLKQINSKNYHHFFPRSYLKRQGYTEDRANHIANITIVDDYLNKREIGDKPPATYMEKFRRTNPRLAATMRTHLIDLDYDGIWENDYDTFFRRRCERIAEEVLRRISPRETIQQSREQSDQPSVVTPNSGGEPGLHLPHDTRVFVTSTRRRFWIGRHTRTGEVFYRHASDRESIPASSI